MLVTEPVGSSQSSVSVDELWVGKELLDSVELVIISLEDEEVTAWLLLENDSDDEVLDTSALDEELNSLVVVEENSEDVDTLLDDDRELVVEGSHELDEEVEVGSELEDENTLEDVLETTDEVDTLLEDELVVDTELDVSELDVDRLLNEDRLVEVLDITEEVDEAWSCFV